MAEMGFTFTGDAIPMSRGERKVINISVTQIVAGTETPLNLASKSLKVYAKRVMSRPDSTIAFTLATTGEDPGIAIASESAGTAVMTIEPALTWALPNEAPVPLNLEGVWVDSEGVETPFYRGLLQVWPGCRVTSPE